jgi:hypothetical protein
MRTPLVITLFAVSGQGCAGQALSLAAFGQEGGKR